MAKNITDQVGRNQVGWDALQHKDGWWVGDANGVICYTDPMLARAALTIAWQRDGGRALNYRIKPFTHAEVDTGEFTPKYSGFEALARYEAYDRSMTDADAITGGA
jgi:hypothetical protein